MSSDLSSRERIGHALGRKPWMALEVTVASLIAFLTILMPTILLIVQGTASLWFRRRTWLDIGMKRPASWRNTLTAATVLAVASTAFSMWIAGPAIDALTGEARDFTQFKAVQGNVEVFLLWMALSWVLGGFLEEMAFRGYLLNRSLDLFGGGVPGMVISVALNASAFGVLHTYQGLSGILNTGLDAAIFSVVYLVSRRNLWLTIFMHGIGNSLGLIAMYFGWFGLLG